MSIGKRARFLADSQGIHYVNSRERNLFSNRFPADACLMPPVPVPLPAQVPVPVPVPVLAQVPVSVPVLAPEPWIRIPNLAEGEIYFQVFVQHFEESPREISPPTVLGTVSTTDSSKPWGGDFFREHAKKLHHQNFPRFG